MNSAGYNGVLFSRVSLASKNNEVIGEERFPGPAHDLAWSGEDLFFLAGATPSMSNTSSCVYKLQSLGHGRNTPMATKTVCIVSAPLPGTEDAQLYFMSSQNLLAESRAFAPKTARTKIYPPMAFTSSRPGILR